MAPWQFQIGNDTFRLGFAYERAGGFPLDTYALVWAWNDGVKKWQRTSWEGRALLHPADVGKFSYKEGRRRAVQRLLRAVPPEMRPVLAQTFFGGK